MPFGGKNKEVLRPKSRREWMSDKEVDELLKKVKHGPVCNKLGVSCEVANACCEVNVGTKCIGPDPIPIPVPGALAPGVCSAALPPTEVSNQVCGIVTG
jgi:hypothetical protein